MSHIYNKNREIQDFPDELQKLAIKLMAYRFTVVYVPGKKNILADFLSRNPIKWGGRGPCPGPCIEDDSGKTIPIEDVVKRTFDACAKRREEDPSLMMLKEAAAADREYTTILEARIRNITKSEIKELPQDNPCRSMVKIWDNICLLYTSPSPRDGLLSRMPSSA